MESVRQIKAIAKREWSSYFNSAIAYVFIIIFLILSAFFTFNVSNFYEAKQANLRSFFMWHPWLFLILVPAVVMRLWSEERRSGTIELLFTLSITPAQAILGKFLAAWGFIVLTLALTFPIVITTEYLGNPDIGVIIAGYVGSALLAGAYIAVGMLTSAMTKNQVIAFILAVIFGLFLILAGFPPVTGFLTEWAPTWLIDIVASFSFMTHFQSMEKGIIDLKDVLYFTSVIVFMLFATQQTLENRT